MKSPFPGMDPYLEQHWGDVHARLVLYACDQLQALLPSDLLARVEERVFVESPAEGKRSVRPDVRVIERPPSRTLAAATPSGTVLAEPLVIHAEDDPITETFIEIVDAGSGRQVITVIEILSLANKVPGDGQDLYLRKQRELKQGRVSLVAIDLLRAGQRNLSISPWRIPPQYRTAYQVCVRRGWRPQAVEVYPVPLWERLPGIRIPLRQADADAPLDLQSLVEECYRKGRYDTIDYRVPPDPPLEAEDSLRAERLLRESLLR